MSSRLPGRPQIGSQIGNRSLALVGPVLVVLAAALLACGDTGSSKPPPAVGSAPPPISGIYEVSGTTVETGTGSERGVAGKVILKAEGDAYSATFSLATTLHGASEAQRAEVVGQGEGTVSGRSLTGTAETQLIVALVPGVDPAFGLLPRTATTRILNHSNATIDDEGVVEIEIESKPAAGQSYTPTRTTLRGRRVSNVGLGDAAE